MKKAILTLTFLSFLSLAYAQVQELTDFNRQRLEKQRISMLILGSWAVGNIALGAALATQRDGEDKYFHAMNAGWNVVNLGLATAGYLSAVKTGPAGFDLYATINEQYIHYVDEGEGPAILFSHPAVGWSFMYRDMIKALSRQFRCIAIDYPGFGLSDTPEGWPFTLQGQSEALEALKKKGRAPKRTRPLAF